jgi:short-subunit dehydrogenase
LVARRQEKLEEVAEEVEAEGGSARVEPMDVRDESGMRRIVEGTYRNCGRLDTVVANAGVSWKTDVHDLDLQAVRDTFDINVNGALHLFEPALDIMLDEEHGHLVAVSSMASFRGLPGKAAYCASKAALARMAESFRLDLDEEPVDVTTIYPGYVETPMTDHYPEGDLPFLVPVDEAARTMRKAIEQRKKRCVFPWQMDLLSKVINVLPSGLVDMLVQRTAASMTENAPTGPE